MNLISRSEEVVLLTILKLGKNAYGVSIREQIYKDTGDRWSYALIYTPLDKLARKKYVIKTKTEPTPERGGKSKYLYQVTEEGLKALRKLKEAQAQVWSGIPQAVLEQGVKK
jgi:DNA-binding PadR family transcriptional regulator